MFDKKTVVVNARFLTQKVTGVQRYAIELSKRLLNLKSEFNVIFVSPPNICDNELADTLNVKVVGYNTGHIWEKLDLPIFLKKIGSPLLLCFCNSGPLFYRNQIVAIHDTAVFANPKWFSKKFVYLYKFSFKILSYYSKHLITVSDFSKQEIINYLSVNNSKIHVIYNGTEHFKQTSHTLLPKNRVKLHKYLLCVGSIEPRKNIIFLLEGFTKLSLEYPDLRLKIVGGGNKLFNSPKYLNYLTEDIRDRIDFLGYISDSELIDLYKNAYAFIYPSLYEGFGIPPLEAMLFGCPVAVSNVSSLPEVCGSAAIYFEPNNLTSLTQAISFLIDSESITDEFILKGTEQVLKFSWDKSVQKLGKLLNESLNN